MPNPEPIQQRIEILADTRGAEQTADALDTVEQRTRENASAAIDAARSSQKLDQTQDQLAKTLRELAEAEVTHQTKVDRGEQISKEAARTSQLRKRQITGLGAALREEATRQDRVNRLVNDSVASGRRSERQIDRTTGAIRRNNRAYGQASAGGSRFGGVIGSVSTRIGSMVSGLVGVGGLVAALQATKAEMLENAQASRQFQKDFTDLQFLSDRFNPQEKEFVKRAAVFAGRTPGETAGSFAKLKSRFPDRSDRELQTLFLEIAETARTTPAPLDTLTEAFSGLFNENQDAQRSQNILRSTQQQAGISDPAKLAVLFGKFLGPATTSGKLTDAEAAGVIAAVTGLTTQTPEEQVQGILTFMLQTGENATPEVEKILGREGIDRSADFLTRVKEITKAVSENRISQGEFEVLASREGVKVASSLLDPNKIQPFFSKIDHVKADADRPGDPTRQAIQSQFRGNNQAALQFAVSQTEAEIEIEKINDNNASEAQLVGLRLDLLNRRNGESAAGRAVSQFYFNTAAALGLDPVRAAVIADPTQGRDHAISTQIASDLGLVRGGGILVDDANTRPTPTADRGPGLIAQFQNELRREIDTLMQAPSAILGSLLGGEAPTESTDRDHTPATPEPDAAPTPQQNVVNHITYYNAPINTRGPLDFPDGTDKPIRSARGPIFRDSGRRR